MPREKFACAYCGKEGFKSKNALNSHIKAKHPTMQEAPRAKKGEQQVILTMPLMEPGLQVMECPFCHTAAQVYIKDDGTVGQTSDLPKPPSSSHGGTRRFPKRAAHPIVIAARIAQRWNNEENRWKNTVAMMGTHGRTAPKMPWYEPGIAERWLLNDSHSIEYIKGHLDESRVDRWWQMHHRWRFTRRQTRYADDHWSWLQETKVPRIFMQRHYADVPNSEGFKIREISDMFIGNKLPRGAGYVQVYYTNTFSYMLAQVAYEKKMGIFDWERVEIYGCELEQLQTEYFRQRPGMEWWLGVVANMGIEVYFPQDTFIAFAQDVVNTDHGQMMVQYPGYMAYGYKSPSLEEAKENDLPVGVDPVEENLIGAWEDSPATDYIFAMNEGLAQMVKRHTYTDFEEDYARLDEWLTEHS